METRRKDGKVKIKSKDRETRQRQRKEIETGLAIRVSSMKERLKVSKEMVL